ncbi:AAA+ ATPase domain [Macleaya cordata]|uniref:ATP-dependent DNA helicase n=1 Tax=Macleaya cordata TaxID=56857 RepID=A0A200Q983_MACCD|nr:AAA+ ATPase domain [Macleaya cordata]
MREGLMIRLMRLYVPSCIFRFLFPKSLTSLPPPPSFPTSSQRTFCSKINTSSSSGFGASKAMNLTKKQQEVLTAISNGKSVFLTGSAGTGKTFLLQQAISLLNQIHNPNEVFITASTGVAACALNGQTLHSFSGIGLGEGGKNLLLNRVYKNKPASKRWRIAKALVIDEISMVSGELFDKLEFIARKNRPNNKEAWGGIQLIVSGDFFQLPPVIKKSPSSSSSSRSVSDKEFAFEADCWNSSFGLQVELTQVFRQSDSQLIDLLQGIRRGFKDDHHLQLLRQCCSSDESSLASKIGSDSSSTVPRLYPRNEDVKRVNDEKLRNLGGEIVSYRAVDSGNEPWKSQLKQGMAPEELEICLGARVMLIKNKAVESGLVNGATGTIIGFIEQKGVIRTICPRGGLLPKVRFDSGREMLIEPDSWDVMEGETVRATRKQVPLILAWAISIHKCQGMSLDSLHTDLSRAFGCGMVYVALSRVRSLAGLHLSGFNSSKIKAHPKVLQFYEGHLDSD